MERHRGGTSPQIFPKQNIIIIVIEPRGVAKFLSYHHSLMLSNPLFVAFPLIAINAWQNVKRRVDTHSVEKQITVESDSRDKIGMGLLLVLRDQSIA
jgi:hypothetical protein